MARPNLRKSPDLSKPSRPNLDKKEASESSPNFSESSPNFTELGISREVGSIGGVTVEARAKVDLESLLPQQGITIGRDESKNTLSVVAGVGSVRGKLGVNIGAEMGFERDGSISLKSASGGVNVAGFGAEGKIGQRGSGGLALTGFGITIDVAKDENGNISGGINIRLPGGEIGLGFQPDAPKQPITSDEIIKFPGEVEPDPFVPPDPNLPPQPIPPIDELVPPLPNIELPFVDGTNLLSGDGRAYVAVCVYGTGQKVERYYQWNGSTLVLNSTIERATTTESKVGGIIKLPDGSLDSNTMFIESRSRNSSISKDSRGFTTKIEARATKAHWYGKSTGLGSFTPGIEKEWTSGSFTKRFTQTQIIPDNSYTYLGIGGDTAFVMLGSQAIIAAHIKKLNDGSRDWKVQTFQYDQTVTARYQVCQVIPVDPTIITSPQLPNYPQHFKPMDCCDKVEEIYKYLGIAKLKKNKFPVSKAFLVPGGTGKDECIDYYAITQALFRMLANGLIINPKSKPLGSDWQSTNATAWASNMYEMMAESMSDGNTSQRFEVAAIMQLVQIMSAVAESSRKIEFVADAIGLEPETVPEELPVCFTVYEEHKGFGKAQAKKLKTSNLKTDSQVEEVLGKMLTPSLVPIVRWKFKPGQISINEALKNG